MRYQGKALGFAVAAVALLLVCEPQARAEYIVTLTQVGSNVVATGSGTIDLAGLSYEISTSGSTGLIPSSGEIATGPLSGNNVDVYTGLTGPTSFGSGGLTLASSGSGDYVVIEDYAGLLGVPSGYVSGSALSDSATYDDATFASLGLTPGNYLWSWGGIEDDSFALNIVNVPEPGSLALFAPALLGLGFMLHRKRAQPSANRRSSFLA